MIVADSKPFEQVKGFVENYEKILVVGCGTCVTVCLSGGEAQVQTLAAGLRIAFQREGKPKTILEDNVQRQCDEEFVVPILERVKGREDRGGHHACLRGGGQFPCGPHRKYSGLSRGQHHVLWSGGGTGSVGRDVCRLW